MAGHIVRDGATGQAIVSTTGTPVNHILEALACGHSHHEVLQAHPGLTAADIAAALRFAQVAVQRGATYAAGPDAPRTPGMHVRESPVVYGAPAAPGGTVTLDVAEHQALLYRIDLLEQVLEGERELAEGLGIPHDELFSRLFQKFGAE